jgi:peptide/nickel transport system substrate-binding protein
MVGGEPLEVKKLDSHTVVFELAQSYGAGERIFDSISILPRHVLAKPYQEGKLSEQWNLASAAQEIVGLGPFRLEELVPGQRLVLAKNPHYWKTDRRGRRLPYLNRIVFQTAGGEQTEVIRFQAGQIHLLDRVSPQDFELLKANAKEGQRLLDLGPGLDYNFLFFNLNELSDKDLPGIEPKQVWFRNLTFRRAVSSAIDRESIIELVYDGRATPLATHVTPGNKFWVNDTIKPDTYSTTRSRELLRQAGFSWNDDQTLLDTTGAEVSFSILTTAGNTQRAKIATIIQDDLGKLGIKARVVTMDFRSAIDRIFTSYDYEACVLGLRSGDVDPTAETNVWVSSGSTHLWHLGQSEPATEWEAEIDRLMKTQMISTDQAERKRLYDRVQQIIAEQLPIIPLASPNILVGVDDGVGNFRPGVLAHYTLWNADELFFEKEDPGGK